MPLKKSPSHQSHDQDKANTYNNEHMFCFSISPIVYNEYTKFIKRRKRERERDVGSSGGFRIDGDTAAKTKQRGEKKYYPAR